MRVTDSVFTATIKNLVAQYRSMAVKAAAGVGVLAVVCLFTANPFATFFRLVTFAGIGLMLISIVVMILTFKKAREVASAALLASLAVALLSTFVMLWFMPFAPPWGLMILAVLAGGLAGAAWSRTTRFFIDGGRLRMCGTIWYLAVWALTLAFNQGGAIITGRTPVAMTLLTLAGAGIATGNTLGLILRTRKTAVLLRSTGSGHHV